MLARRGPEKGGALDLQPSLFAFAYTVPALFFSLVHPSRPAAISAFPIAVIPSCALGTLSGRSPDWYLIL